MNDYGSGTCQGCGRTYQQVQSKVIGNIEYWLCYACIKRISLSYACHSYKTTQASYKAASKVAVTLRGGKQYNGALVNDLCVSKPLAKPLPGFATKITNIDPIQDVPQWAVEKAAKQVQETGCTFVDAMLTVTINGTLDKDKDAWADKMQNKIAEAIAKEKNKAVSSSIYGTPKVKKQIHKGQMVNAGNFVGNFYDMQIHPDGSGKPTNCGSGVIFGFAKGPQKKKKLEPPPKKRKRKIVIPKDDDE